jgi:pimeloyl-ACP methyl ester carboxylesterase
MKPEPDRSGFLAVDGVRVYWERHGRGDRDLVCLLNGIAQTADRWRGYLPRITDEFDVLLIDYPGQGQSTDGDLPYSLARFADYVPMVLDELGCARAHVVGISTGSSVAVEVARLHPGRCLSCALTGIVRFTEPPTTQYDKWATTYLNLFRKLPIREFARLFFYDVFSEALLRDFGTLLDRMLDGFAAQFAERRGALERLFQAQFAWVRAASERRTDYRRPEVPTLIIAGEEDLLSPAWIQRELSELMGHWEFEMVAKSGHLVFLDRPDEYFAILRRFVRRHAGRAKRMVWTTSPRGWLAEAAVASGHES